MIGTQHLIQQVRSFSAKFIKLLLILLYGNECCMYSLRVPLKRRGKFLQKVEDIAAMRRRAEFKYGGVSPDLGAFVGDDPEPLTDYQNVGCGCKFGRMNFHLGGQLSMGLIQFALQYGHHHHHHGFLLKKKTTTQNLYYSTTPFPPSTTNFARP